MPTHRRFPAPLASCGLAALALLVTACMNTSSNSTELPPTDPQAAIAVEAMPPIEVAASPSPSEQYRLLVTFDSLPGALTALEASANYAVVNPECVPPLMPSGARLPPEHSITLDLPPSAATDHAPVFAADALQDADYFGLGVCRWGLNGVSLRFRSPTTVFSAAIDAAQVRSGETVTLHFLASDFATAPVVGGVVFGEQVDRYTAESGPRFTASLKAETVAP